MIAKVGGGERPLGLPTIKDRVIQTAAKLVLEPIFEADMDDGAYGYRPKRSAADAVKKVHAALIEGYTEVVDADLSKYFDKIPHDDLMRSIALRIVDGSVLSLLKSWLQVPVQGDDLRMSGGKGNRLGTPQGGVISPLLANRYMNRFLRYWRQCDGERRFSAKLVNYADDFVILSKGKAQLALAWTQGAMTRLKLEINETKTSIKNARAEQFDFLGYRFGLMHNVRRQGRRYLGARASDKSMQKLKDTVGELLHHRQSGPWSEIRDHLNRTLSGWRNYFHYGSVRKSYTAINHHVSTKVRNFLQRRHKVPSRGTRQFSYRVIFDDYGVWKMTSR